MSKSVGTQTAITFNNNDNNDKFIEPKITEDTTCSIKTVKKYYKCNNCGIRVKYSNICGVCVTEIINGC